jgi:hypothetical protein
MMKPLHDQSLSSFQVIPKNMARNQGTKLTGDCIPIILVLISFCSSEKGFYSQINTTPANWYSFVDRNVRTSTIPCIPCISIFLFL